MKKMSREFIELALRRTEDLNRESLYELHTLFRKGAKRATATGEGGVDAPNVRKKMKRRRPSPSPSPNPRKRRRGEKKRWTRTSRARSRKMGRKRRKNRGRGTTNRTTNLTMRMNPTRNFSPPRTISMAVDGSSEEEKESDEEDEDVSSEEDERGQA